MSGYGVFAYYYDRLTENVDYAGRGEYLRRILHEAGIDNGLMLDLACGTGKMSIEMARAGYEVIGVDASEEMLSIANQNAFDAGVNILFLCQQMQSLDLFGTVRSAICTLDSLNHLTDAEQLSRTFERVSLFLESGGCFVFDINTPYKHREILGDNTFVYDLDDLYCVWQNTYDRSSDSVDIDLDIFVMEEDGLYSREYESFSEKTYEIEDVKNLLIKYGFDLKHIYEDMTFSSWNDKSQRVFFFAVKR